MSLRHSVLRHFVTPSGSPRPAAHEDFVRPDEVPDRACAEPAPRTPSGPRSEHGMAASVGVLCPAADTQSFGAAMGLALTGRQRAGVVVVCIWMGETPAGATWSAPPRPAARRLATGLAARGHDVRAAGRLAIVRLPGAAGDAVAQARRVSAASGSAPVVLALGGPRDAAFDDLLAEQDLVVVATPAGTDPALARLAVAGLSSGAGRACVCEMPPAHHARSLAAAGLTLLPSARRALAGPVEALS